MKNVGNPSSIINVMKKAAKGEHVTIAFIGGSITQGAVASDDSKCYAYLVYKWWTKSFPKSEVSYINAGIGATTSQFAAARANDDILKYDPDFVVVEFSVNDNDERSYDRREFFKETYEGLIRKILSHKNRSGCSPALLIVHSVRYDDGGNEEGIHAEIGRHYGIPCISMKELIYDRLKNEEKKYRLEDITQDMLHPNDLGHKIVAGHITDYLEGLKTDTAYTPSIYSLTEPLTANRYEQVTRYNNLNCNPDCKGFIPDKSPVKNGEVRDVFKNGWTASNKGAVISFSLTGTEIGVMYRKSVNKPAPVAYAVIDGNEKNPVRLDANFDEDWGDKAYMTTLIHHGMISDGSEKIKIIDDIITKEHSVTITLEEEGHASDFYLICIICG